MDEDRLNSIDARLRATTLALQLLTMAIGRSGLAERLQEELREVTRKIPESVTDPLIEETLRDLMLDLTVVAWPDRPVAP